MTRRIVTEHTIRSPRLTKPVDLAVVTDLHDGEYASLLPRLSGVDAILLVGDMVQRHSNGWQRGLCFLREAPDIAPTYMSLGNHELLLPDHDAFMAQLKTTRVILLDNCVQRLGELALGGLSSAETVDVSVVDRLAREDGFRLLLCHHPEYYAPHVAGHGIDLTLAGHAHGGQIQLFGHGIYAPGQGLFPRLTHGFYDNGRLLVSRGVTNGSGMPRWGNPCELIILHLLPEE